MSSINFNPCIYLSNEEGGSSKPLSDHALVNAFPSQADVDAVAKHGLAGSRETGCSPAVRSYVSAD